MPTDQDEQLMAAGKGAIQARTAAHASYSQAADVVRERLMAVQSLIDRNVPASSGQRINAEAALEVAERMKTLTEHELEHAERNWAEWLEETRSREQNKRLERQEKTTRTATVAAWGSAVAALVGDSINTMTYK